MSKALDQQFTNSKELFWLGLWGLVHAQLCSIAFRPVARQSIKGEERGKGKSLLPHAAKKQRETRRSWWQEMISHTNMTLVALFIHQGPLSKSSKHFLKVHQVSSPFETQEKLLTVSHWGKKLSETQERLLIVSHLKTNKQTKSRLPT